VLRLAQRQHPYREKAAYPEPSRPYCRLATKEWEHWDLSPSPPPIQPAALRTPRQQIASVSVVYIYASPKEIELNAAVSSHKISCDQLSRPPLILLFMAGEKRLSLLVAAVPVQPGPQAIRIAAPFLFL